MRMIGRWGDRQHPADRLDPIRPAVIVDEGDHGLCRRSSSAWAKYALRLAQDLVGLAKLAVLPLQRLEPGCHVASSGPGLCPLSRSAFFTHSFSVCDVQPILARYRDDRRPSRRMLMLVIQHQPHRTRRGPQAKTCSSSCLSSLHLLKSWSLRQTRGGSRGGPTMS